MGDHNNQPPIVLSLLECSAFNVELHNQVYLRMQVHVFGALENANPENNQYNYQEAWNNVQYNIENQINIHARRIENLNINNENVNNQFVNNNDNNVYNAHQQPQQNVQDENSNAENFGNHYRPGYNHENIPNLPNYEWRPTVNIGNIRTSVSLYETQSSSSCSSDNSGYSSDEPER